MTGRGTGQPGGGGQGEGCVSGLGKRMGCGGEGKGVVRGSIGEWSGTQHMVGYGERVQGRECMCGVPRWEGLPQPHLAWCGAMG